MFAVRAPTRRSGKTLLVDCISLISTGRKAPKFPQVRDEEEERKRFSALGIDGDLLVCYDNLTAPLGSAALDLVITSGTIKDRYLGHSQNKEVPIATVFFATGNNLTFRGDMAARSLVIDLAPTMEHPEMRTGFLRGDADALMAWVLRERSSLVTAALTMLLGYLHAGCPPQDIAPYGGFDQWSNLVRHTLVWLDCADPNQTRDGLEASSDEGFDAHAEFLTAWHACYGEKARALTMVIGELQRECTAPQTPATIASAKYDRLKEALGNFDDSYRGERLNAKRIGRALRHIVGRVIDNKRLLRKAERGTYGTEWSVESLLVPF